jgi:Fic family protein
MGIQADQIASTLDRAMRAYEKEKPSLDQILEFHVRLESIHPFEDYNGRVGRVIMMKECLRHGIDPFIIDDKRRGEYNRGIAEWDEDRETLRIVAQQSQARFRQQDEMFLILRRNQAKERRRRKKK